MNRADGKPLVGPYKTFTLGVDEVSPLSMAEAYATFAARGTHCTSVAILEITDPAGNRLSVPQADCEQAIDQNIADGMNELLQGVIERGTGARAAIGRPAAGKTGTTNRRVSVWFVGYTPDLATAVWAGNPSPPAGGYPLQNRQIGGVYYDDVCGGCLPGPIWQQMMSRTLAGTPVSSFTDAEDTVRNGDSITVPSVTGKSVDEAKALLRAAKLDPVVSGNKVYVSYAPAGTADRSGLLIAGDDAAAKATATQFLDAIGYDAVDAGPLAESWRFEPDTPAYGLPYLGPEKLSGPGKPATTAQLQQALAKAQRS